MVRLSDLAGRSAAGSGIPGALLSVVVGMVMSAGAHTRDLGAAGPLYPIAEPDMIDEITSSRQAKQASGELARLQQQALERARASIREPQAVPGLHRAQVARSYRFDPSIRVDEPILDDKGRVVVAAGTVVNPLAVVSLRASLLLFDGRDAAQVAAARAEVLAASAAGRSVKPVLVAGSPAALSEAWQRPVYFDQGGRLVQRFGIAAVPARVSQDGLALRIEEVPTP